MNGYVAFGAIDSKATDETMVGEMISVAVAGFFLSLFFLNSEFSFLFFLKKDLLGNHKQFSGGMINSIAFHTKDLFNPMHSIGFT